MSLHHEPEGPWQAVGVVEALLAGQTWMSKGALAEAAVFGADLHASHCHNLVALAQHCPQSAEKTLQV